MAADGLTTIRSKYGPKETMDRLEAEVKARGMTIFAHIDHAAGASAVGLPPRPTNLLIFGNAKGGTPLYAVGPNDWNRFTAEGFSFWQDVSGGTRLSYNDTSWLAQRHWLGSDVEATVNVLTAVIHGVAKAATGSQQ